MGGSDTECAKFVRQGVCRKAMSSGAWGFSVPTSPALKTVPSLESLERLAYALQVPLYELFRDSVVAPKAPKPRAKLITLSARISRHYSPLTSVP
jgi:hypothetical protein